MKNKQSWDKVPAFDCLHNPQNGHSQDYDGVWRVSSAKIFEYFVFGCFLALISDIPLSFGTAYVTGRAVLYALLITSLFLSARQGLFFLLLIAVVGQDIIQTSTESVKYGVVSMASVWQGQLGPLNPSWIILIYCMVLFFKNNVYLRDRPVIYALLWFTTVPLLSGFIYGGFETEFAANSVIVDLKFPIFMVTSIILFRGYLKKYPHFISTFVEVFVGAVLARHLVTFLYWLNGIGSIYDDVNRASVDSTKGTIVFVFLLSVYLVLLRRKLFWGGALGVVSGLLIVVYTTRMLWLTTLLGIIIVLLSMRFNRWLLAIPIFIALVIGSILTLQGIAPENIQLATIKGGRLSRSLTEANFLEQLDPPRYAELLNIFDANMKRSAILWGSGYGSYYTESAKLFPTRMPDAFPEYMFRSGQFYTSHNYFFLMLFKHGVIGLVIISCLWLVPGWRCFKIIRKQPTYAISTLYLTIVAFLPTSILTLYWSGKGAIISGFLVAIYLSVAERFYSSPVMQRKEVFSWYKRNFFP